MATFADLVALAKTYGIFEYYLPFVILFSLFYGLLTKSKIFGEPKETNRINLLLSLGVALYVMAYTPIGFTMTQFFATFFTQVTVVLVTILAFMMILTLMIPIKEGESFADKIGNYVKYFVPFGALVAAGIFLSSGGLSIFPGIPVIVGLSAQDLVILGLIVLTVLVIWWMTKPEGVGKQPKVVLVPAKKEEG